MASTKGALSTTTARQAAQRPTLVDLPIEILLCVLSCLETRDVGTCAMTARALAAACDDRALWARLHEQERAREEARWRARVRSVAPAIALCTGQSERQNTNSEHAYDGVFSSIACKISKIVYSSWHASIDLVALLGHPRFACAARANIRVVVDSSFYASALAHDARSPHDSYATVGTIVSCSTSNDWGYNSDRVAVRRGFFDAYGAMCGPGVMHVGERNSKERVRWRGYAGMWTNGLPSPCQGDALYRDSHRYRGGLSNGLCHGRGHVDTDGTVVVAGEWKHGVAHGSCSWRSLISGPALVGNAPFVDGSTSGPVACLARGRMLMCVPHMRHAYRLGAFVDHCPPMFERTEDHRFVHTRHTYILYGPSGATILSDKLFAHAWPDGAIVVGGTVRGRDYYSTQPHCKPTLYIDTGASAAAPSTNMLLVALGTGSVLERDPRTHAVRVRVGQGSSVDPTRRATVERTTVVVDESAPIGLAPDAIVDREHAIDTSAVPATDYAEPKDYALTQDDFARAIISASHGRTGLDEADAATMSADVCAASDALLGLLDTRTASSSARPLGGGTLSGGRVRCALYVADAESRQEPTTDLNMSRCAMRGCVIVGAEFVHCDLRRAHFERCVFYGCHFVQCAFFGAVLVDTRFEACAFSYSMVGQGTTRAEHSDAVSAGSAQAILAALGAHVVQAPTPCASAPLGDDEEGESSGRKRKRPNDSSTE
ncbi:Pentapeptide repeat containing protein [Pandoravirus salinus]|uniref:Pentapeptide repeat containing protein n=1 Tax=Pandoravirus salinus TaxID=1349410 RepID=S4VXZ2_9VIRU|nr:Pentapeptide repeat-containing protein [Pandoravirus salinus]AGO84331.1 Pentapeptide repeat containing protein [Pandoravirus salinus]